jgi:hypothetical protein
MAQTKGSSSRSASSSSSKSRSTKSASKSRSTGRSSRGGSAKRSGSSARKQPSARARRGTGAASTLSGNGHSTLESVTDTVSSGAQNTAKGVAGAAKKAKAPLIAGGVAIAGLAGAAALNARSRRRKVLGVTMPRGDRLKKIDARKVAAAVTDAAERADGFGQRVSNVANRVQKVSETADKAAKKS